jgi:signal transduction histidine kinase
MIKIPLKCPRCDTILRSDQRFCPSCSVDVTLAAIEAEGEIRRQSKRRQASGFAPDMLVPRLGERLVECGLLTADELSRALAIQKNLAKQGEDIRIGQLLVAMGFITRDALDQAVTEQVLGLQNALRKSNQLLEQRVEERTEQLEGALGRLAELSQLKANFIANVSHELRTPLHLLIGYVELLAKGDIGPLTSDQAKAINTLQGAGSRLRKLVEDLLQFTEATTESLPMQIGPLSIKRPVRTAVSQNEPMARSQQVQLSTRLPSLLPRVKADDEKITWVIGQFLDNAIKFTPPGGEVKIQTRPYADEVLVAVTDTGIGMPAERIDEAFLPFHQLDGSATRRHGGTGLGLAMARNILEAHGAEIMIDSQPGEGTSVAFALPVA